MAPTKRTYVLQKLKNFFCKTAIVSPISKLISNKSEVYIWMEFQQDYGQGHKVVETDLGNRINGLFILNGRINSFLKITENALLLLMYKKIASKIVPFSVISRRVFFFSSFLFKWAEKKYNSYVLKYLRFCPYVRLLCADWLFWYGVISKRNGGGGSEVSHCTVKTN